MALQTVNQIHYAEIINKEISEYLLSSVSSMRVYANDILHRHDLRLYNLQNIIFFVYEDRDNILWFIVQEIDGEVYTIH